MKLLLELSKDSLKQTLSQLNIKPFVANQIFDWVFKKHVLSFDDMKNISKQNRDVLAQHLSVFPFKDTEVVPSADGLAIKTILTCQDDAKIECVILKEKKYYNLCVSTQCGCPVDCKFCLTGITGFKRNLTPAEILGQILWANYYLNHELHRSATDGIDDDPDAGPSALRISHLVFMGMGEPLLNYKHLMTALKTIHSEDGFFIGTRKVTVSTSGFKKTIQQLIDDDVKLNLAFSVGCVDREKRKKIMPVEEANPILDVAKLLKEYLDKHNRQLTLEYTLLKGVNDTDQDIQDLIGLAKYLKSKINLINLNTHSKIPFDEISNTRMNVIKQMILQQHVPVTIRFRKGRDIAAACGQLGESRMEENQ